MVFLTTLFAVLLFGVILVIVYDKYLHSLFSEEEQDEHGDTLKQLKANWLSVWLLVGVPTSVLNWTITYLVTGV